MIPKIIWQTYETSYDKLPDTIKNFTKTWIDLNPEWSYKYMNADERENFVLENFGKEWHNIFINYPFNILRSDLWRYMVVYIYGGIYIDIDTICKKPIDNWIDRNLGLLVSLETDEPLIAQYIFAAEPKNKIIKHTLNLIKNKSLTNNKYISKVDYVYETTGPLIWTHSIREMLGFDKNMIMSDNDYMLYNKSKLAKKYGFYCFGGTDWKLFNGYALEHIAASKENISGYISWQKGELENE